MDKYEYRVKTEQMLEYMENRQYKKAMEIADTIDWRRVKNATMLNTVSEIYEYCGEFQKSRDILFVAFDRSPNSRKIVYRLGTLALKINDIDEASDCYEEFVKLAPKDSNQYILKYRILRARRAPLSEQIAALEDFKKAEYVEKWAYELAKLYQEAGMTAKCLEECDDLILWFSEGKYVVQAMELKMKYKPLTPLQQEKYEKEKGIKPRVQVAKPEEKPEVKEPVKGPVVEEEPVKESVEEPVEVEADATRRIPTGELTKALAELEAQAAEAQELPEEGKKSSITTVVKGATLEEALVSGMALASGLNFEEKKMAEKEEELLLSSKMMIDDILQEWEEKQKENAQAIAKQKEKDEERLKKEREELEARREAERLEAERREAEEVARREAEEAARREAEEAARREAEEAARREAEEAARREAEEAARREAEEAARREAEEAARREAEEKKSRALPEDIQKLVEELEGAAADYADDDFDIEEELEVTEEDNEDDFAIDPDFLDSFDDEDGFVEEEYDDEEYDDEDEFDEEEYADENDFDEVEYDEDDYAGFEDEDEFDEDEFDEDEFDEDEFDEDEFDEDDFDEDEFGEVEEEDDFGEESFDEENFFDTDELPEIAEPEVEEPLEIEEPSEEEIQKRIKKSKGKGVPFDTGFVVTGRYDLSATSEIGLKAGLTEEQKKLFSYFVPVRGMSEQIVEVLDNDRRAQREGTSCTGNLLVIGRKGSGKTVLAVDIVKAIQKQRNLKQGKVAIVTGESLNKKDLTNIIQKLRGGAIIIEKAGKLNSRTIQELNMLMEKKTGEMLFVLEDQRKPLERILTANPDFKKKFTSKLELPVFINDELVTFGQTYAKENGYKLDEMGILALYSRIDVLQREDHAVTVAEVKEIMDEAIAHSQKANVKHLARRVFGRSTDESDRIILKEEDFKI
ncbi:hypothetical protein [Faecalicatena contorta]|uniref:hypothetical protein n=1 Tax=Faecalicatena contorta TaxID=39482 RepID=UPI002F42A573|nr:hypothetical protein [Faecalicatena contorta]